MKHIILRLFLPFLLLAPCISYAQETTISGKVVNAQSKEPMIGVNVAIKGTVAGTITDASGSFRLNTRITPPFKLTVSFVGFQTQEIDITQSSDAINIELQEQTILTDEVVVSASRVEESVLKSPVTVEKMDIRMIRETPAANFYDALANIKGVDMNAQSMTFKSVTTRGFGANGQTRVVQMIDGMDNQAPGLNFSVGNIVGISELDLESVELLPGAASALYGPNALNGIILMSSKNPFQYQGLSATFKTGVMHVNEDGKKQTPMYDASIRYAKAFNNKFGIKANFSWLRADDWQATDYRDQSYLNNYNISSGNRQLNQAYNGVNTYGDEASYTANIYTSLYANGQVGNGTNGTSAFLGLIATQDVSPQPGTQTLPQLTGLSPQAIFAQMIPNTLVGRTGYEEQALVDYTTISYKGNLSLHYRVNDKIEAILQGNLGNGTTVYTGNDRYSLRNFWLGQVKAEIKGSNFFLRAYTTQERSGESYAGGTLGVLINEAWKPSVAQWFPQYFQNFGQGAFSTYATAFLTALGGGQSQANAIAAAQTALTGAYPTLYTNARNFADQGRLSPGTDAFYSVANTLKQSSIPNGAKFLDKTNLWHYEGMYNFSEQIKFAEIVVGANYRVYDLNSEKTLFAVDDSGKEFNIPEWGAYVQVSKKLMEDKLKLTGSLRHDKRKNFKGVFSPRLSAVYTFLENHNLRLSYQTGFRLPTTQDQYIDLVTPQARLIGGVPFFIDRYNLKSNPSYTLESVTAYGASVQAGTPDQTKLVLYNFPELKPEKVNTYEIGYKSLIGNKLYIDAYYYYTIFNNFLAGQIIVQEKTPSANKFGLLQGTTRNVFGLQAINRPETIKSNGWAVGLNYALPAKFTIGTNVCYNKLLNEDELTGFQVGYNTPLYRFNVTLANREVAKNIGFSVAYRWQDKFLWQSSFVNPTAVTLKGSEVPAYSTVDAQVTYKIPSIKSSVKIGASNLLNKYYTTAWGNPSVGGIYYISLSFDELMNR
jgi:outer membrane receptor protein involved in Fe transport